MVGDSFNNFINRANVVMNATNIGRPNTYLVRMQGTDETMRESFFGRRIQAVHPLQFDELGLVLVRVRRGGDAEKVDVGAALQGGLLGGSEVGHVVLMEERFVVDADRDDDVRRPVISLATFEDRSDVLQVCARVHVHVPILREIPGHPEVGVGDDDAFGVRAEFDPPILLGALVHRKSRGRVAGMPATRRHGLPGSWRGLRAGGRKKAVLREAGGGRLRGGGGGDEDRRRGKRK